MAQGDSVVVLNQQMLHKELNTPQGDLWRWLDKKGGKALNGAQRQVGVNTGRLIKSLHMRHLGDPLGQSLWIGSNTVRYGYMHHEGTRPHVIAPKAGSVLKMRSGRIVHGPVRHPGTKPNRFLSSQLHHFRY